MRGLKRILSWTIWSLLSLYIAVLLLIQLPTVQTWMGGKVASALAAKLGTSVSVGRVSLGLFNRLIIDDVCIPDLQGDTLLRVGRLSVKAKLLQLMEGRIAISSAQLFGAHARLYKADENTPANYQFVIDAFSSNDTTSNSNINLAINSLIVRHSSVTYDFGDDAVRQGQLSPRHLAISDISTHVALKELSSDSINVNLKRLTFAEQSGLTVKDLTARMEAGKSAAHLRSLRLQLPSTTVAVDTINAYYNFDRLAETLRYEVSTGVTTITPAELTPIMTMASVQGVEMLPTVEIESKFTGTTKSLDCQRLVMTAPDGSLALTASGFIDTSGKSPQWQLQVDKFDLAATTIAALKNVMDADETAIAHDASTSGSLPTLPDELLRVGNIHLAAIARRQTDGQAAGQAEVATSLGNATLLFTLDKDQMLNAQIATDSLHLGRLTDNTDLGHIAANISLNGNKEQMDIHTSVAHLGYKGHDYANIEINGVYQAQTGNAGGRLTIDDNALKANIEGRLMEAASTVSPRKAIHLAGSVDYVKPATLNLSEQWGDASFSANINADIEASSINDAQGHATLTDFYMHTERDSTLCHISQLKLTAGNEGSEHFLKAVGDMGEMELHGEIDLETLPQSMTRYLASKLPTLPGLQTATASPAGTTAPVPIGSAAGNSFTARLSLNDTRWLQPLLGLPLSLDRPLLFTATIDDTKRYVDLKGQMPSFTYSGVGYRDMSLNITTEGDTALCQAAIIRDSENGGVLRLDLDMKAANNNIVTALLWDSNTPTEADTMNTISGKLNTVTQLYTNKAGKTEAHIRVKPSLVMIGKKPWSIRPSELTYAENNLRVDSFAVRHGQQHLIINGTASERATDTLAVDMNGLEIAYIQDLLDFHPVDFSGLLGGRAYATALFGKFAAWADITAPGFRFLDGRMGTLFAKARWNDNDGGQIDIDAVAREGARGENEGVSGRTIIKGYISPTRSDIDLNIRAEGTNIEFCQSFTNSFLSGVAGKATGDVELKGPLGDMNLTGALAVDGRLTVTALNTTYLLHGDTIHFVPDDIQFRSVAATDKDGNRAVVNGGIHHQSLSDFTFDVDIDAQNLLVYDFPAFDGSNICGTVHATGTADLHGRPGEIVINCNVTPQTGSVFAYNAANPDAVSQQEFITFSSHSTDSIGEGGRPLQQHDAQGNLSYPLIPNYSLGSDLRINFLINATPESTLRLLMDQKTGDYITLNGSGTLRATFHNRGPFTMFGTYTVDHGTYGITIQNIIKKNFIFQDGGTIVFGGDPYDATLNLQAVYTVNGVSLSDLNLGSSFASNTVRVNCLMNIQGTPSKPNVDFDLDMPTVNSEEKQMIRSVIASEQEMNQQVLYLLGIGRFYTQGANNADTQQYDQTTLAMQSFLSGTVSTQINEVLSQIIKSNDWNFGANISTGDEGWRNAEYEGMVSGRLLDNRLLINGQFGYRDNATKATPSFIGDFDLRYLLKRNGNLAVKVYNQTNDRYFTRSSLNTQGLGLVMKKDFDGLGDLLRKKKKTGHKQ